MDDLWLVEAMDTGPAEPQSLCSPGGNSSGYCSSEENHMVAQSGCRKSSRYKQDTAFSAPQEAQCGVSSSSKSAANQQLSMHPGDNFGKANASFDGFASSLWEPLSEELVNHESVVAPPRRIYREVMAKHLVHSQKTQPIVTAEISSPHAAQSMAVWNHRLAAELSDSFTANVDDCEIVVKTEKLASEGTSVDPVIISAKGQCSALPSSVVRPLARTRAGATLVSCGSVLRHSTTVPNKMYSAAAPSIVIRCTPQKRDYVSSQLVPVKLESKVSTHEALIDHMYALKPSASLTARGCQEWSRSTRTKKSPQQRQPSPVPVSRPGKMSILEAFLRSTTPRFDANRGSTELVAEELRKLHPSISDPSLRSLDLSSDDESGVNLKPMPAERSLLKHLLTSELDGNVLDCTTETRTTPGMAVDSLLTDGFGLDANLQLDDPLSNGIGLLQDDLTQPPTEMLTDEGIMMKSLDLNADSVTEQSRQERLWWQHYVSELL